MLSELQRLMIEAVWENRSHNGHFKCLCEGCSLAISNAVKKIVLEHSLEVKAMREELTELRFLRPYVVANEQVMQAAWTARRIFRDACTGTAMPDEGML